MFLKKKLLNEDPYKQETRITELAVPDTGPINEARHLEQISIRFSSYDSMLDFLVNFCQFEVDYLNLDRIRKIVGLIRYIDWVSLTPDSKLPNTKIAAELVTNVKAGGDSLTLNIIGESLTKLPKCTAAIMGILRDLTIYHKETYKTNVRSVIAGMPASEANAAVIKKKMNSAMHDTPFYPEFIEELIKEDYSKDGPALQEAVLKSLKIKEQKQKAEKPKTMYKDILLGGLISIGAGTGILTEIAQKLEENQAIIENREKTFWEKIKELLRSMTHSDPNEVIYELQFIDQAKGTETRENLNFHQFRADIDKKIKIYSRMNGQQGPLIVKLKTMPEEQVLGYLERAIKDMQSIHRTLTALDEFFKSSVPRKDRSRIKGIKPELASIKNCYIKANQIRHEYSAQKEEEEQMKKLGINPDA